MFEKLGAAIDWPAFGSPTGAEAAVEPSVVWELRAMEVEFWGRSRRLPVVGTHDVGTVLDHEGTAVRTGHHCAQPVMDRYGIPATTRASLACFNTRQELDALARGVRKVQEMFR